MSRKRNKTSSSVSERVIGDFAGRPIRVIIVVISLIAILFPLYWLIANSLRTKTDYLANPPILFNAPVTFQNYQKILVENGIYKQFANTFVVAAVSTIIAVVFGSMAAYSTVRGRIAKKIRNFFGLWFMIQKMYPAIATAIPVYLVMRHLRLIDTRFALIIMNTSFNLPLVIWLMMGFFEQIPLELEESAKIDGANFVQRFFRIVFPVRRHPERQPLEDPAGRDRRFYHRPRTGMGPHGGDCRHHPPANPGSCLGPSEELCPRSCHGRGERIKASSDEV